VDTDRRLWAARHYRVRPGQAAKSCAFWAQGRCWRASSRSRLGRS